MCACPYKTSDIVNLKGSKTTWIHSLSQQAYPLVNWHHILLEMLLQSQSCHFSLFPAYCLPLYTLSFHFLVVHCFFCESIVSHQLLLLIFYVDFVFSVLVGMSHLPSLLVSILADTASASSYATFHQPQHHLSIHLAVTQETWLTNISEGY